MTRQYVIATCDDLMLANDCVSDLKSANIGVAISLRPSEPVDVLNGDGLQTYGSYIGGSTGRGILSGGLIGLAAGGVISLAISTESLKLSAVTISVALCAAFGGIAGWRRARRNKILRQGHEQPGRFVLRCDGDPDEIGTAFEILQTSPCRNVRIVGGSGDTVALTTSRTSEAPVA